MAIANLFVSKNKNIFKITEYVEKHFNRALAKEKRTKNLSIVNAMYNEAVALGVIPMKDPLDGLEDTSRNMNWGAKKECHERGCYVSS